MEKEKQLNLFDDTNIAVFVNITQQEFLINKFTSNAPDYFGYSKEELQGLLLSDLMPKRIQVLHNSFVLDFVNQRRDPIYKTAMLKSFAFTKNRQVKMVSVLMKLEFFMIDDVYLSGIIIDDPCNVDAMILTEEDGKVISINDKAAASLGTEFLESPYSLFLSMPLLLKYYFPSHKSKENVGIRTFDVEGA